MAVVQASEILKRDKRGRLWMKPKRREALLDEFEKSGMSGAQFARLTGVNYSSFQNWVQRRRKHRRPQGTATGPAAEPGGLRLFEAVVESDKEAMPRPALAAPSRVGLLIELPGGSRMEVGSPVQLRLAAELLAMIAQAGAQRC